MINNISISSDKLPCSVKTKGIHIPGFLRFFSPSPHQHLSNPSRPPEIVEVYLNF